MSLGTAWQSDSHRRALSQLQQEVERRSAAERSERQQRQWFQTTLASIGDAVITTDHQGRVTFLNDVALSLTGWQREDAFGKALQQLFVISNADTGLPVDDPVARVLREGVVAGLANHTRLTAMSGLSIPIDDSAAPIRDEAGNITGVVLVFRDISGRENAEEHFRTLTNDVPSLIWMADTARRFTWFNRQWLEFLGADLPQALALDRRALIHPDDYDRAQQVFEAAFAARDPFHCEYRVKRHDGAFRWLLDHGSPMYGHDREFCGYVGSSVDLTERKGLEQEILDHAEEIKTLLDATPAYVWIAHDAACEVVTGNPLANALLGVPTGANVSQSRRSEGRPVESRSKDGTLLRSDEMPVQLCTATGQTLKDREIKIHTPDGKLVDLIGNVAPIFNAEGKVRGCIAVFIDITGRKATEDALRNSDEMLRHANESLKRANEDLRQFAFAASHDLQEPLRIITTYSEVLAKRYPAGQDSDAALSLNFIAEGSRRMRELLADLLGYSEVTAKPERSLPNERVNLNVVVREVTENLRVSIDQSHASITSETLPTVPGRYAHYVQLLQNPISNGIKYCGRRPPEIHISAERKSSMWQIAVRDNGIGIAPEYHQKIFGVFKRLHGRLIPGTGVGLAICERVVERYGGKIWVDSRGNEGATFFFTLPAEDEEGVQRAHAAHLPG